MRIILNEIDIDILHKLARGETRDEIAASEGLSKQTIKNRIWRVKQAFGAQSVENLIAILIASNVLYVPDLYDDYEIIVREYRRSGWSVRAVNLETLRP